MGTVKQNKGPKEVLEEFLYSLMKEDVKWVDILPMLTKTQQHTSQFIGKTNIVGPINGLHSIIKQCDQFKLNEKYSTNPTVTDVEIHLRTQQAAVVISCRLVKEEGVRKPAASGDWGINVNSFKFIK